MNETGDLFGSHIRQGLSIATPPRCRTCGSGLNGVGTFSCRCGLDNAMPEPLARRSDPRTSVSAAESMVQGASRHRTSILTALTLYGAATCYELGDRLGLTHVQVARRTAELAKSINGKPPKIRRIVTGRHHGRNTYSMRNGPNGSPCCVWQIVP
jgi:hypothetical protein